MSKRSSPLNLFMLVFVCAIAYTVYFFYTEITEPEKKSSKPLSTSTEISLDEGNKNKQTKKSKIQPSVPASINKNKGDNATAKVLGIDEEQYQVMKEDYFCDLAATARENCELQQRSEEAMEICLKMGSYYTNSRHCGYQP